MHQQLVHARSLFIFYAENSNTVKCMQHRDLRWKTAKQSKTNFNENTARECAIAQIKTMLRHIGKMLVSEEPSRTIANNKNINLSQNAFHSFEMECFLLKCTLYSWCALRCDRNWIDDDCGAILRFYNPIQCNMIHQGRRNEFSNEATLVRLTANGDSTILHLNFRVAFWWNVTVSQAIEGRIGTVFVFLYFLSCGMCLTIIGLA